MMEENLVEASFNQGVKRQVSEKNSGLKDLEEKLKEIRHQIAEMKENVKHRMDVSSENKTTYYNTIIFNGDVDVTGKITVTDTFTDNINGEDSQKILDDIVM